MRKMGAPDKRRCAPQLRLFTKRELQKAALQLPGAALYAVRSGRTPPIDVQGPWQAHRSCYGMNQPQSLPCTTRCP